MDTVTFDGVIYQKASLIAKEFRYTNDYVGQLCRKGKVRARMIGRTWYVDPTSVSGHRDTKYSVKNRLDEKSLENNDKKYLSRIDVLAVPGANSLKFHREVALVSGSTAKAPRYFADEDELLPPLIKHIPIKPAEATKLKISRSSKVTLLKPDELPEVVLRGNLMVSRIADVIDQQNESQSIPKVSTEEVAVENIKATKENRPKIIPLHKESPKFQRPKLTISSVKQISKDEKLPVVTKSIPEPESQPITSSDSMVRTLLAPIVVVVSAFVLALASLSLEQVLEVRPNSISTSYHLEALSVTALANFLYTVVE